MMGPIGFKPKIFREDVPSDVDCPSFNEGYTRLLTHHREGGRIDMELDAMVRGVKGDWFHVYDALNDGDLSGSEDKVLIGGDRVYDKQTCELIPRGAKSVKDDPRYAILYQQTKRRFVQSYVNRYLDYRNWDDLPPQNDDFFGRWVNFVRNDKGEIISFKVKEGDRFCKNDPREGVVKTVMDIDYQSAPEEISLIVGAVWTVNQLKEAVGKDPYVLGIDDVGFEQRMCEGYGRCKSFNSREIFWQGVLTQIDSTSNACSWSFDKFFHLYSMSATTPNN